MIDITPHGWVGAQPPPKEAGKSSESNEKAATV
jgi:hypothetical protein